MFLKLIVQCFLFTVLQHHGLLRERNVGTSQPSLPPVSDAERKLILTALYYIIIGTIATVSMSISSKNGEAIKLKLGEYFRCSSAGAVAANICQHYKDEADVLMNTEMIAAAFTVTIFFPVVHLFYAFSISKWCKKSGTKQINSNSSVALKRIQV